MRVGQRLRRLGTGVLGLVALGILTGGTSASYYEEQLPSTLNPLYARSMADRRSQELVFDRLFYRSAVTNQLKSRLVAEHEPLAGGLALRLQLNQGIRWHDGKPFQAVDVCFTVATLLNPNTPSPVARGFREVLAGCRVEADHTVVIEFLRPVPNPRERLSFAVLPKRKFDSSLIPPDLDFATRPVGTGPMQAVRGRREVKFTAAPTAHRPASIGELSMASGRDPLVQVRNVQNAGVHGVITVPPPYRSDIAASDDVSLKAYDLRSWWYVALNPRHAALKNPKVRQALDVTLDRNQLVDLTIGVDPNDVDPPVELVSGPFVQSSPYYNRAVPLRAEADLVAAGQHMTEAGARKVDGRWHLGGAPIKLRLGMQASLDAEARDLLNQVANQLRAGGFEVEVHQVPSDEWVRRAITGGLASEFDALIGKWSFGVVEDVNALFHTRTDEGLGSLNLFAYSNPEVDKLLASFDEARTVTEAQDAYHALHALLARDLPYLFLWKLDTRSAWRNEVRGNTITPYYYFTEFDGWRL